MVSFVFHIRLSIASNRRKVFAPIGAKATHATTMVLHKNTCDRYGPARTEIICTRCRRATHCCTGISRTWKSAYPNAQQSKASSTASKKSKPPLKESPCTLTGGDENLERSNFYTKGRHCGATVHARYAILYSVFCVIFCSFVGSAHKHIFNLLCNCSHMRPLQH